MSKSKSKASGAESERAPDEAKREVMLKPGWPGVFHRTVGGKRLEFLPNTPVELTEDEFKGVAADIGIAIFEVSRDVKGRPRFVESEPAPVPTERSESEQAEKELVANV